MDFSWHTNPVDILIKLFIVLLFIMASVILARRVNKLFAALLVAVPVLFIPQFTQWFLIYSFFFGIVLLIAIPRLVKAMRSEEKLFRAVKSGDLERVKNIVAAMPRAVQAKDRHDNTPLHWAAQRGRARIAETLVAAGANLNALNAAHRTPLDVAQGLAREFLVEHGAQTGHDGMS